MVEGAFRDRLELNIAEVPVLSERVGDQLVGQQIEVEGFDVRRNRRAVELCFSVGGTTSVLRLSPVVAARIGAALVQKGLMS